MTITLDIRSDDVQHSWWIPELGGKTDALPGYTNKTWFKVDQAGRLPRPVRRAVRPQPRQHVRARSIALPFDEWQAWYDRQAHGHQATRQAGRRRGAASSSRREGEAATRARAAESEP